MKCIHHDFHFGLLVAGILTASPITVLARAQSQAIGINVLLNAPVTGDLLADLAGHGQILDVIPEIHAVTIRAHATELPAIRALAYVAGANPDARRFPTGMTRLTGGDFADGANQWSLDATDVTDFGWGRTVNHDGEGVYVAVLDTGLVHNWREYFPEERIATQHARAFAGGGGQQGTVSSQPNMWERDTEWHGTAVTSIILGFRYFGSDPALPATFNGVAPKVTVIPIKDNPNDSTGFVLWSSTATRSIVYVTNLKISGALGEAPVVINMSQGGFDPDVLERAAIDYAIANGIVYVAAAGNEAAAGMRYPGAYAPVISAAATGWVDAFPPDDPTTFEWILRDVPEGDVSENFIAPFSSWELPGQDLDVAAPGWAVPAPWANQSGRLDYSFFFGTSAAAPHVTGVVALMLQKNPHLTAGQVEAILETTAMPLPPGCADFLFPFTGPGNGPTWSDHGNVRFINSSVCWELNATGHGLLQADAALSATPLP